MNRSVLKMKNGLPYFEIPEMAKLGWLRHGFLTRRGGVSSPPYDSLNVGDANGDQDENVFRNRAKIAETFGFEPSRLILLNQIHQDRILLLKDAFPDLPSLLEYDALITNIPNLFSGILTADCIPIFVVDHKKRVFAVIHAGRQGTAMNITAKVIRRLKKDFASSPQDLIVGMGPSIGPCCYEIDEKVFLSEWEPFSTSKGTGKWMVDLSRINLDQIEKEGIKQDQIFAVDLCTRCQNDLFFSYRKEAQTGRQLSFIGIKQTTTG